MLPSTATASMASFCHMPLSTETSGTLGNIVDGAVSQEICYVSKLGTVMSSG